ARVATRARFSRARAVSPARVRYADPVQRWWDRASRGVRTGDGWARIAAPCAALLLAWVASVRPAAADQLSAEPYDGEVGYSAIEELSYEAFIDATDGFAARFRIRVALRNASLSPRDAVHTVALPFAAHLEGLAIAHDGQWSAGVPTQVTAGSDRRDPGSVFVRPIAPRTRTDVPAAEIVVFGLDPGAILQVELSARVYPRLRGDRWELDLPARGSEIPSLAAERRILVPGLSAEQAFFVDDRSNEGRPFIVTRPTDGVTVAWPARIQSRTALEGHLEAIPGPPGFDDGDLRLFLRGRK